MNGWWSDVSGEHYPVLWIGRTAVVKLPAEIDINNADQVREDLLSVLNQGAAMLIADLSSTTFCDSAGVSALVRTFRRAAASQSGMRLVVTTPAVERILTITGVDRLLDIYRSVAASLAAPPGPAGQDDQPQPGHNNAAPADTDGGVALPDTSASGHPWFGVEDGRRLRGLAGDAGDNGPGNVTELDVAVLRRGPQDGEGAFGGAALPGHDDPQSLVDHGPRGQRRTQLLDEGGA